MIANLNTNVKRKFDVVSKYLKY